MGSLALVIVVASVCALWVWRNHQQRQRWLERLDLPGTWHWEDHDGVLELEGELDGGRYRIREDGQDEQGSWHLEGHDLVLQPRAGSSSRLDVRLFTEGKIGVHGPGREHRIYIKQRSNVVPLRRPA